MTTNHLNHLTTRRTAARRWLAAGALLVVASFALAGVTGHRDRPVRTTHVETYTAWPDGDAVPGPAIPCPECR